MSSDIKKETFARAQYREAANTPLKSVSSLGYAMTHLLRSAGDGAAFIIALDKKMRIIHTCRLKRRGFMSSEAVADTVKKTVDGTKAAYFILAHNHKNGILEPSAADRITTDLLVRKYQGSGVVFLEHFIVSCDAYVTMIHKPEIKNRYDSNRKDLAK